MVKKYGKFPANARVDVDYTKGKPKIKFDYPKNGNTPLKQSISQHSYGTHSIIIIIIFTLVFSLINSATSTYFEKDYPQNCDVSFNKNYINISSYIDVNGKEVKVDKYKQWINKMNITCDGEIYTYDFNKYYTIDLDSGFQRHLDILREIKNILFILSLFWILVLVFFYFNKIITRILVKNERYKKWFPKHQAGGKNKSKKYKKFKPSDVEKNLVFIPSFNNVELNYNTKGDFSKQLERIKIREHSHNKYKKGIVGDKQINLFKWTVIFYFKNKPKDGYLEVIYQ